MQTEIPEAGPRMRAHAEWYEWARRSLPCGPAAAHAAAVAAIGALETGADVQGAITQAKLVARDHRPSARFGFPPSADYAQWFFWARSERGLDVEESHTLAARAIASKAKATAIGHHARAPELPIRLSDLVGGAAVVVGMAVALAASPQPVAWAGPLAGVAVFLVLVGGVVITAGRRAADT